MYFLLFLCSITGIGQTLTISDSGDTGSFGTNWSIENGTFKPLDRDINLHPSVIENVLECQDFRINSPFEIHQINVLSPIRTKSNFQLNFVSKRAIDISAPIKNEGGRIHMKVLDTLNGEINVKKRNKYLL
jgi:hypothetical protein